MNRISDLVLCDLLIGLVLFGGGCDQLVTGPGSHDKHEEEHLEHRIPAHRPANFTEAVNQINSRYQRMKDKLPTGEKPAEEVFQEVTDIVRWLPEIAADSEMQRKNWRQVVGTRTGGRRSGGNQSHVHPSQSSYQRMQFAYQEER
jgi:hypothetical protein